MSLLSSVYPNFAAFYTTTWTRSAAAAYLPPGSIQPPIPISAEYGPPGMLALHPHGLAIPFPMVATSTSPTGSTSSSDNTTDKDRTLKNKNSSNKNKTNNNINNNNNVGHSFSKFTIDEILGKKESKDKDQSPPASPVNLVSHNNHRQIHLTPLNFHHHHHHPSPNGFVAASDSDSHSTFTVAAAANDAVISSSSQSPEGSPEDADANARFSWLQCTRYKPPKLPSKYWLS